MLVLGKFNFSLSFLHNGYFSSIYFYKFIMQQGFNPPDWSFHTVCDNHVIFIYLLLLIVSMPQLVEFYWRVDLKAASGTISRLSMPTCLVQFKVNFIVFFCFFFICYILYDFCEFS